MITPSHRKSIKSNMESVFQSMNIEPFYKKSWANMKRLPKSIASDIKIERLQNQEKLNSLLNQSEKENFGRKKFLVVKKIAGLFAPIGFRKTFKTIEDVIDFARQENREVVRVIKGIYRKDYEVVSNSTSNTNQEVPITFHKNGRGKTLWNAKRNNINGFGKTKIEAENDLVNTEKNIKEIRGN